MRSTLLTAGLLVAGLLAASASRADTEVNCGDVLSVPGQYFLADDITCSDTPAVRITANDVHFNLRGHRITRAGGNDAGIEVGEAGCPPDSPSLSGIHINNGIVDGFDLGINACRTTDLQLNRVGLLNSITAVLFIEVSNGAFTANTFTAGDNVVVLSRSHSNRFHGNRVTGLDGDPCHRGYLLGSDSNNNIVTSSEISGCNGDSGVALLSGANAGNIIRGNRVTGGGASFGIVAAGGTGNIIQANHVTGFATDLRDLTGDCDSNTWKANTFETADPGCLE